MAQRRVFQQPKLLRPAAHSAGARSTALRRMSRGERRMTLPSRAGGGSADVAVAEVLRGGAFVDIERQSGGRESQGKYGRGTNSSGCGQLSRHWSVGEGSIGNPLQAPGGGPRTAKSGSAGKVIALGVRGGKIGLCGASSPNGPTPHCARALTPA
jgi:hypothetical protein